MPHAAGADTLLRNVKVSQQVEQCVGGFASNTLDAGAEASFIELALFLIVSLEALNSVEDLLADHARCITSIASYLGTVTCILAL